jgi:acyl-CoA thioester hydrolase
MRTAARTHGHPAAAWLHFGYKAPARFNDVLLVSVVVKSLGRASVVLEQDVHRAAAGAPLGPVPAPWLAGAPPGEHVCTGELRIACVDAKTLYPRPLPEPIYLELKREH